MTDLLSELGANFWFCFLKIIFQKIRFWFVPFWGSGWMVYIHKSFIRMFTLRSVVEYCSALAICFPDVLTDQILLPSSKFHWILKLWLTQIRIWSEYHKILHICPLKFWKFQIIQGGVKNLAVGMLVAANDLRTPIGGFFIVFYLHFVFQ